MEQRLKPIEKPASLLMRLAYWMSKKQFGKVLSPLKQIYARLPFGFTLFTNKISTLSQKVSLPEETVLMVKIYVAQINICSFCIDIALSEAAIRLGVTEKFEHLFEFRQSSYFTEKERAILLFTEELTIHKKVSDATYQHLQQFLNEQQMIEVAWLIATEHYYNLMNIAFNVHSDNLCDITKKKEAMSLV